MRTIRSGSWETIGLICCRGERREVNLIIVLMIVGAVTFALRGIMYAQIEEMKVPAAITGTVSGFLLTVGFSPEAFQHIIFGYWLDTYKLDGYIYMFAYMAIMFAIAVFTSIYLYKSSRSGNPFAKLENELNQSKDESNK